AVVTEFDVGRAECAGDRDRDLAAGQEACRTAAACTQLGRGEFVGIAVLGHQVDARADRGCQAEVGRPRIDSRYAVQDVLERASVGQDPVERRREVLHCPGGWAIDDAVPLDSQAAQGVTTEL